MSCQIKDNKYYAQNGQESQLFKDLSEIVGEEKASDLFVLVYSDVFNTTFLNQIKTSYNKSVFNKINKFTTEEKDLSYKVKKVNNFETIQMYQGKDMLGYIRLKPYNGGLQVERVLLSDGVAKGKGLGTELYKKAIQYSLNKGVNFYSDGSQTQDAKKVWDKLKTTGIVNEQEGRLKVEALPKSYFDKNGEPLATRVIEYAREQNENVEPLSTAEKVDLQLQFSNFETSDDLLIELNKAFYKEGLFNPTKQSLTKVLYSEYEAENLLSDISLLSTVKDSLERLKRTETIQNGISLDEQIKSSDLNIFGKFKLLNPAIVRQDIIEEFGGVKDADISEIKDKSITEEQLQEYKRVPVIDEDGNAILNKIVYENGAKLVEDSSVFEALTEEDLKEKLLDYGIKIEEIEPITLKNFLENPSVENTLKLNQNAPQREKVIKIEKQDRELYYLETLKTEEQLFNELQLVQTEAENIYHKVEKVDEQELRDFLKAENTVAEYQLYKDYYNYKTPVKKQEDFKFSEIETDIDYLRGDFIADFNAEILKNSNHDFYNKFQVNEKGILLKYNDSISLSQIKAYIQDKVKLGKELADYSVISKNMPNFKEDYYFQNNRVSAINNKSSLKIITSQQTQIDRNSLLVKNETSNFISYNNEVYELKNKEGNESVYTKLNSEQDLNYFQTAVETQEYVDQIKVNQQKLEKYNVIKKMYKTEDLEDNFDCAS